MFGGRLFVSQCPESTTCKPLRTSTEIREKIRHSIFCFFMCCFVFPFPLLFRLTSPFLFLFLFVRLFVVCFEIFIFHEVIDPSLDVRTCSTSFSVIESCLVTTTRSMTETHFIQSSTTFLTITKVFIRV